MVDVWFLVFYKVRDVRVRGGIRVRGRNVANTRRNVRCSQEGVQDEAEGGLVSVRELEPALKIAVCAPLIRHQWGGVRGKNLKRTGDGKRGLTVAC